MKELIITGMIFGGRVASVRSARLPDKQGEETEAYVNIQI